MAAWSGEQRRMRVKGYQLRPFHASRAMMARLAFSPACVNPKSEIFLQRK
jgi:hypothetical protein